MKKTLRSFSLIMTMLFVLMGCTPAATNSTTSAGSTTVTNAATTTAATTTAKVEDKGTVYPITIKSASGTEVEIKAEPKKIVSLSPTFTEVIYALGKGDKLVGRTDFCDYPSQVSSVASVGSMSNPSIEKIVEMNPDIVITSFLKEETVKKIEAAGAKVVSISSGDSLEGSFKNMKEIGKILNANKEAEEIVKNINTQISEVTGKLKDVKPVKTYYVAGFGKNGDYTAGNGTFINEMIKAAGGENVAIDAEGWSYTSEKLVEKDPTMIFMGSMAKMADEFKTTEPYKNLTAVKNNQVFEVDDNLIAREGPRLGEGIKLLAKLFHPDVFK
ncbi:MAG: ABC transporter substrate-binding protein [Clostridiaceae bacterium]